MIAYLFAALISPSIVSTAIADLPELSVAVKIGDASDYTLIKGEESKYTGGTSVGGYSSRVSAEGASCELKIPVNTALDFYVRTKSGYIGIPFSIFRMEVKDEKKRVASSSDLTGNKLQKIRINIEETDPVKKIFHVTLLDTLTPGTYGCLFKSINKDGHFASNNNLGKSIFCFEITN